MVDEAGLVEDGESNGETIGGDERVDRLGPVDEVVGQVLGVLGIVPEGDHALVGIDELIDVALAQALLRLAGNADLNAVAGDGGRADGSGGGRSGEGEGGEETHLELLGLVFGKTSVSPFESRAIR